MTNGTRRVVRRWWRLVGGPTALDRRWPAPALEHAGGGAGDATRHEAASVRPGMPHQVALSAVVAGDTGTCARPAGRRARRRRSSSVSSSTRAASPMQCRRRAGRPPPRGEPAAGCRAAAAGKKVNSPPTKANPKSATPIQRPQCLARRQRRRPRRPEGGGAGSACSGRPCSSARRPAMARRPARASRRGEAPAVRACGCAACRRPGALARGSSDAGCGAPAPCSSIAGAGVRAGRRRARPAEARGRAGARRAARLWSSCRAPAPRAAGPWCRGTYPR